MCAICRYNENYESLEGLKQLYCCKSITQIPVIKGLQLLNCVYCPSLITIPVIEGLQELDCSGCRSLKEIPVIKGLKELYCSGCRSLKEIPVIKGLQTLVSFDCTSLTKIPEIHSLKEIYCSNCPSLTSIPMIKNLKVNCFNSPWVNHSQNKKFYSNVEKLKRMQSFCRKNFKYFLFKRWIKSREFAEWFYDPKNFGGYKVKQRLEKMF